MGTKINYSNANLEDKLSILAHLDGVGLRSGYKGLNLEKINRDIDLNRPIHQYDKEGNLLLDYSSAEEVIDLLGVNKTYLIRMLKGEIKSLAGYVFSYEKNI